MSLAEMFAGHPGRGGRTDATYAELARVYTELLEHRVTPVLHALAERYGSTPATWSQRITEARRRDLLPPEPRGRPSRRITNYARFVLGETSQ